MKAIDLFSDWALKDRDMGMEKNHMPAVKSMLSLFIDKQSKNFSFIFEKVSFLEISIFLFSFIIFLIVYLIILKELMFFFLNLP